MPARPLTRTSIREQRRFASPVELLERFGARREARAPQAQRSAARQRFQVVPLSLRADDEAPAEPFVIATTPLPPDLAAALSRKAKARGLTESDLIRESIEQVTRDDDGLDMRRHSSGPM